MTKGEERLIHGDKVFSRRRVEAFITSLVKGIPIKDTFQSTRGKLSLVRAMIWTKAVHLKTQSDNRNKLHGRV